MSRSHYLKTRLTPAEHAQLKSRAGRMGLTVSQLTRAALVAYQQKPYHAQLALASPPSPSAAVTPLPVVIAPAATPTYAYQQTRKPS